MRLLCHVASTKEAAIVHAPGIAANTAAWRPASISEPIAASEYELKPLMFTRSGCIPQLEAPP